MSSQSSSKKSNQGSCDESCLIDGLLHANVLGDAAKKGYHVLFFSANPTSNSFTSAINKLHSALIGSKIFKIKSPKSPLDTQPPNVYAHCARKMNGGVTLMGINFSNTRAKINAKLSSSNSASDGVVSQYLLSIADGHVMLNNERFNGSIAAAYKFKKFAKNSLDFTIPPYSVVFLVMKNVNCKICSSKANPDDKIIDNQLRSSSSDDLLKALAANVLEKSSRSRRQITLPKIDFKLASLMQPSTKINQRSINNMFFNKNAEIYKPDNVNPLMSSENPALPNGDIFLNINDGNHDYVDAEVQYVKQQQQPRKNHQRKQQQNQHYFDMARQASEASYDYVESTSKKPAKKSTTQKPIEIGEIGESEHFLHNIDASDQSQSDSQNVEIKTVMRELEPTYRQSKKALMAARRKLDQSQLMELLNDATLQFDQAQIKNGGDYQLIDLTQNDDDIDDEHEMNYEEYEEDEDGFFGAKVRTRRAAVDYRKNEIPHFGDPFLSSEEEELDAENDDLMHSIQKFKPIQLSTLKPVTVNSESPMGVKIIDIFSKSLDDIIGTVHKNLISWWYVFQPPMDY